MYPIDMHGFGLYTQKQFIEALSNKAEELSIGEVAFMLKEASERLECLCNEVDKLDTLLTLKEQEVKYDNSRTRKSDDR